ncbi:hypothetical protein H0X10_02825 [Candidatus Saccharibacteria bacterium]|nr:hypothetical protein [Candidatus Saccharibacteria bacterium]
MSEKQRPSQELDEIDRDTTAVDTDVGNNLHTPAEESAELVSRKAQFSDTMGRVALMRAGLTMDNLKDEDQAKAAQASPYNQDIQPETNSEKRIAARLQKKLDKHARLINPKLASKDLPRRLRYQRTRESEIEAYSRSGGRTDSRIRARATIRSIKKVEEEARMKKLSGDTVDKDTLADARKAAVVYRSGTLMPFNRGAVPVATSRREKQARKLERYAKKEMSGNDSKQRNNQEQQEPNQELEHTLDTYFDPSKILLLKAELKHEADRREIDEVTKTLRSPEKSSVKKREQIDDEVFAELLAEHFGLATLKEVYEVVPGWLVVTVKDMLNQPEEELEELAAGTTRTLSPMSAPLVPTPNRSVFKLEEAEELPEDDGHLPITQQAWFKALPHDTQTAMLALQLHTEEEHAEESEPATTKTEEPALVAELEKEVNTVGVEKFDPGEIMRLRKRLDNRVKNMKQDFLAANPGNRFDRDEAYSKVKAAMLPGYLGIESSQMADETVIAGDVLEELEYMLGMDWAELQALVAEQQEEKDDEAKKAATAKAAHDS